MSREQGLCKGVAAGCLRFVASRPSFALLHLGKDCFPFHDFSINMAMDML